MIGLFIIVFWAGAGHDSSEDASACMELMKWKVFQDYMKDNR